MESIREVINEDAQESLEKLEMKIKDPTDKLLEAGKEQKIIDEIGEEIIALRKEKHDILTKAVKNIELQKRINDMFSFFEEQT